MINPTTEKMSQMARDIEPWLIHIRREIHRFPETMA